MRIAIMGAGALGGYFGGRLALAGHDVTFVARGAHLAAMRDNGLTIESPLGDAHVADVTATDDPASIGPVDLVVFVVKTYDTDAAAKAIVPLVGDDSVVVSFQNGVDARARIGAVIGHDHVAGGVALIPADVKAPGVIRHSGRFAKLVFGGFEGSRHAALERFRAALEEASVDCELADDIDKRIWEKFVFLSTFSAICTLTRLPIGPILADEPCRSLYRAALEEAVAVGRAVRPDIDPKFADHHMTFAQRMDPHVHASMLDDLGRGKRIELMDLSGRLVEIGREQAIATPIHAMVVKALHPFAAGPPPGAASAPDT